MATETQNYKLVKPDVDDFYDVADFNTNMDKIDTQLKATDTKTENLLPVINGKVDKINGKGLSTNDFTDDLLHYLGVELPQLLNSINESLIKIEKEKLNKVENEMLMMDGYISPVIEGMYNHIENGIYKKYIGRICVKDVEPVTWDNIAKITVSNIKYYPGTETPVIVSNNKSVNVVPFEDRLSVQKWVTTMGKEIWFDNTLLSDDNLCFYYVLSEVELIPIEGNEDSHSKLMLSNIYDEDKDYNIGEYCNYKNTLYKCSKVGAKPRPSAQSIYWTAVNITDEIEDIKTNMSAIDLNYITAKNAGAHNGIYRGANLLEKYNLLKIFSKISDGSFDDLFVGDYFDIDIGGETMRCVLAGFDLFFNTGDTALTKHHAVVVTEKAFTTRYPMKADGGTAGGFLASDMWTTVIPNFVANLETIIGSNHLISYRTELTNSVGTDGKANGYDWADVKASLLSEIQLTGQCFYSANVYECGFDNSQFPLFALNPSSKVVGRGSILRTSYFLRTVATSSAYVCVRDDGHIGYLNASSTTGAFRPFFLIG